MVYTRASSSNHVLSDSGTLRTDSSGPWRVLVVDDDPDILKLVRYTLEEAQFEVVAAGSARAALDEVAANGLPHLAIVDIMMPEMDGIELSQKIHEFSDLPVIMLTAVDEEQTTVDVIRGVAEDYVTKPFRPKELVARVERVLRRIDDTSYAAKPRLVVDDRLEIEIGSRMAVVDGVETALTPTETKILDILARAGGRTVTTDYLLRRIWPIDEVFEDTLRVHVYRLRGKIEPDVENPRYLVTKRGAGYRLARP